jgi:GntR family transcriptional regulator
MEDARARQMRLKRESLRGQHTSPRRAYEQLRAGIRSGEMIQDDQLVDDGLARQLGASRNSVRRALQMLADDGLVSRERGAGTIVRGPIFEVPFGELLPRDAGPAGSGPQVKVEELRTDLVECPPDVRARLSVEESLLFVYEQMGVLDDEPAYVRIGYIPVDEPVENLFRTIEQIDKDLPPFEECFEAVFRTPYGGCTSTVEALGCPLRIAHMLHIEEGAPILLRELLLHDSEGRVREVSYTHFHGSRIALTSDDHDNARPTSGGG